MTKEEIDRIVVSAQGEAQRANVPDFHRAQFEAAYMIEVVGMHEKFHQIVDDAAEGLTEVLSAYRPNQTERVKKDIAALGNAARELAIKVVMTVATIERLPGVRSLFADLIVKMVTQAAKSADNAMSIVDRFREAPAPTLPAGEEEIE